jgi:ligand-binding sensor domain-containing protein
VGTSAYHEPDVGGLVALDPAIGRFILYHQGLAHRHITAILEGHAGTDEASLRPHLWVGTEEGLAVLDPGTGEAMPRPYFTVYYHNPLDPYSLGNDRIYALYEDRAGILWIATDGGVSRYIPEKNRFVLYRHNPQDPNSLGEARVEAILATTKDTKYIKEF